MATKSSAEHANAPHKSSQNASSSSGNNANREEKRLLSEHADELSMATQRAKWIHSPEAVHHGARGGAALMRLHCTGGHPLIGTGVRRALLRG